MFTLQSPPYQCNASNHYKLKESCSSSLSHCPLTYIKFVRICLYLLNHLITFDCGVTYNRLFCVVHYQNTCHTCLFQDLPMHLQVPPINGPIFALQGGFALDSNIIGVPMRNNNMPKHVCFHNQQFWVNCPTFSLLLQLVLVIIHSLPNMIFTNSKL
jgi:hypothetical protein